MTDQIWRLHVGSGPLIATAVHDGHDVRDEVARHLALSDARATARGRSVHGRVDSGGTDSRGGNAIAF